MKKFLVIVGILCCLFFSLSSCGSGDTASEGDMDEATETMDQAEEAVDEAAEPAEELAGEAEEAGDEIVE